MRKAITLVGVVGLASVALAAPAFAQEATTVAPGAAAPPVHRKLEVGLSFLPMSLGRFKGNYGSNYITTDAQFSPGVSLSAGYEVLPGLILGIAPQRLFNVASKTDPTMSGTKVTDYNEYDLLARISYGYELVETIRLYAEVLPGYSVLIPSAGHAAKGFVLAAGGGCAIDLGTRAFVNLGAGYQIGFQHLPAGFDNGYETSTRYVRFVIGGGARF
jgi:hypothetical protein